MWDKTDKTFCVCRGRMKVRKYPEYYHIRKFYEGHIYSICIRSLPRLISFWRAWLPDRMTTQLEYSFIFTSGSGGFHLTIKTLHFLKLPHSGRKEKVWLGEVGKAASYHLKWNMTIFFSFHFLRSTGPGYRGFQFFLRAEHSRRGSATRDWRIFSSNLQYFFYFFIKAFSVQHIGNLFIYQIFHQCSFWIKVSSEIAVIFHCLQKRGNWVKPNTKFVNIS